LWLIFCNLSHTYCIKIRKHGKNEIWKGNNYQELVEKQAEIIQKQAELNLRIKTPPMPGAAGTGKNLPCASRTGGGGHQDPGGYL
jgi:hypothetical protein